MERQPVLMASDLARARTPRRPVLHLEWWTVSGLRLAASSASPTRCVWDRLDHLQRRVLGIPKQWELFEWAKAVGEVERSSLFVADVILRRAQRLDLKELHPRAGKRGFDGP